MRKRILRSVTLTSTIDQEQVRIDNIEAKVIAYLRVVRVANLAGVRRSAGGGSRVSNSAALLTGRD